MSQEFAVLLTPFGVAVFCAVGRVVLTLTIEFKLAELVESLSLDVFDRCSKANLVLIADHYEVAVLKQAKKQAIKAELYAALVDKEILPQLQSSPKTPEQSSQFVDEAVRLKELEVELHCLALREKELYYMNDLETKKLEQQTKICMHELELGVTSPVAGRSTDFDASKNIRFVPPFNERDVDRYFILFERVASTLKWPKNVWTLLLQCVSSGKVQKVYSSLPAEDSLDFDKVKAAVLVAYELVLEAYSQRFCRLKKQGYQTYIEFAREKEAHIDRWCTSNKVDDFDQLRQLVLMEDFKNCFPERVSTYLNEEKVSDVFKAAVLVDEYVLTQKAVFVDRPFSNKPVESLNGTGKDSTRGMAVGSEWGRSAGPSELEVKGEKEELKGKDDVLCFYCKKKNGQIVANFPVWKKRNAKPVALVNKFDKTLTEMSEASEEMKVPVRILRDTAASQSFILEGVLPFSDESSVGSDIPVVGFGMKDIGVPLHKIFVESDLVSAEVTVGVHPGFPIKGVSFLMGNDLAGGKVLVTPEVTPIPVRQSPDEPAEKSLQLVLLLGLGINRTRLKLI